MIVKPGTFRLKHSLGNQMSRLFANGLEGGLYDAYLPTLWDTSTGIAQVDAAEDPVGLWADRRLGMALGPELITLAADREFTTDTGYWSKGPGWSIGSGVASITASASTNAVSRSLGTAGKTYQITYTVSSVSSQGFTPYCGGTLGPINSTPGTYTVRLVCGTTNTLIGIAASAAGTTGTIDNISVKLLDGNHIRQATAAARPTYRVDANGLQYVALLGTDDNMTSATGGGGTTGFYVGAAIVVAGGAGTAREIYSDSGTNTGIHVEIDASNKLSISAGNGVAFTTLASTATVDVGTKYILEAYISGGVMYLQINGGTAESVAAPTITAGSAGFTIGKDNLLASDFMIGNLYSLIYAKNTGLTEAQRASNRAYLRSKIGL
jgi:hypothetical protein